MGIKKGIKMAVKASKWPEFPKEWTDDRSGGTWDEWWPK